MNLKKDLTIDILSSVQKPARYTGGEFASIVKPAEEVEATIALAFPDVYEVGMSYLGFKILYHLLNNVIVCSHTDHLYFIRIIVKI